MRGFPSDQMRIRPALESDADRLLHVWERSVRATHHFLTEHDIADLRPQVAKALASEAISWWVLEAATGEPIGFLGYAHDTIEALFVDPAHQFRGGGTQLVEHAQALARGPLAVDVNEDNHGARRFYEARGFLVMGRSATDSDGRPFPILHLRRLTANP